MNSRTTTRIQNQQYRSPTRMIIVGSSRHFVLLFVFVLVLQFYEYSFIVVVVATEHGQEIDNNHQRQHKRQQQQQQQQEEESFTTISTAYSKEQQQQQQAVQHNQNLRSQQQQQQQQQQQNSKYSRITNDLPSSRTTSIKLSSSSSKQQKHQSSRQQQQQQQQKHIFSSQKQKQSSSRQLSALSDLLNWLRNFFNNDPLPPTTTLPPAGTRYTLIAASKVAKTLLTLQEQYPNYIKVTTSQKEYGLPSAFKYAATDCPYDGNVKGCLNYYAVVQDYIVHPIGSDSSNALPTVLFSGTVHGNERVGPTAVIEATKLLLLASSCEELLANGTTTTCHNDLLLSYGITDDQRRWLARLVTTRRIIVVPTANALGYYKNVREEGQYDVNRDFPYDLYYGNNCMKTIAARTLNEIFRTYIIQLSLTFHGGIEVIAYEWGTVSYNGYNSPDDIGQNRIVRSMQQYAGRFRNVPLYDIGSSNAIVYPVRGGMEDWAYAGSWDTTKVPQCNPTTYGGYDVEKTTYGPTDLRDFNILVETSNDKIPPANLLGTNLNVLDPTSPGNGHIPRNIRVTLLGTELVEPYVLIKAINGQNRTNDIIPGVSRSGQSCRISSSSNQIVQISKDSNPIVTIDWIVGGALIVNSTNLWYSKWSDLPTTFDCISQPSGTITTLMKSGALLTSSSSAGVGRFFSATANGTTFQGTIDLSEYVVGDEIIVLAEAIVDQQWQQNVVRTRPNIPPQSHIVNIRTNTSWYYKNNAGYTVQGRTRWFSIPPITIQII